jgi:hypothetical protein
MSDVGRISTSINGGGSIDVDDVVGIVGVIGIGVVVGGINCNRSEP